MRSFKSNVPNKVIKAKDSDRSVLSYKVHDIVKDADPLVLANAMQEEQRIHQFRMDPILSQRTGLAKIQEEKIRTEVEQMALEKLKEIQEQAYQEAYKLGLEEGRTTGIQDSKEWIEGKMTDLENSVNYLANLRNSLLQYNEAKIVELAYAFGEKLAMKEISQDKGYIVELLKNLASGIQENLETTIKLSKEDFEFIQSMKEKFQREVRLGAKCKMEIEEALKNGDCIIETSYGVVDASMKERVDKLWSTIEENLPKAFSEGA